MGNPQNQHSDSFVNSNLFHSIAAGVIMLAFTFTGSVYLSMEENRKATAEKISDTQIKDIITDDWVTETAPSEEVSPAPVTSVHVEMNRIENAKTTESAEADITLKPEPFQSESEPIESIINKNDLLVFDADCNSGMVHVFWVTSGELHDHIVLEQSDDSKKFEQVSSVPESILKDGNHIYNLELETGKIGELFFRLRQTDSNNHVAYSSTVSTNCRSLESYAPEIDVFPTGRETFKIIVKTREDDQFTVSLTDLNEIELVSEEFEVSEGENEYIFKPGSIPHGSYSLKVSNGEITREKRVTLK